MRASFSRESVAHRLRALFVPPRAPGGSRIGAEVELLSLDAATGRVASVEGAILPFLRAYAEGAGWSERDSAKGAPRFQLPDGGAVTLEPGGQLEYATAPHASPAALLADLDAVVPTVVAAAADRGLRLVGAGIDPDNDLEDVPLQIATERYRAMDAYFATIGPAGARMMRQTASIQVNIDPVHDAGVTWRVLNAAAPYLTALFANSSRYAGRDTGAASARALAWRALDPLRTGVFTATGDVADEYAGFALWAPAMLRRTAAGEYLPFCAWARAGEVTDAEFEAHLTTLFPEIRPRGYLEVRSIDALPPAWYAAPIVLLSGLTRDAAALAAADDLLGEPDGAHLEQAARLGLADPALARVAEALFDIGLAGARRLGPSVAARDLATAEAYRTLCANGRLNPCPAA